MADEGLHNNQERQNVRCETILSESIQLDQPAPISFIGPEGPCSATMQQFSMLTGILDAAGQPLPVGRNLAIKMNFHGLTLALKATVTAVEHSNGSSHITMQFDQHDLETRTYLSNLIRLSRDKPSLFEPDRESSINASTKLTV